MGTPLVSSLVSFSSLSAAVLAAGLLLAPPAAAATDPCVSVSVSSPVVVAGTPFDFCVTGPPGQLFALIANTDLEELVIPDVATLTVSVGEGLRHYCDYVPPGGTLCVTAVIPCFDEWVGKTVHLQVAVIDPSTGNVCVSAVTSFRVDACTYGSFTQGGWGAKPAGNNPGTVLVKAFPTVYPTGVEIGIAGAAGHSLRFTSAKAIEDFLPSGGTPGKLTGDATNPKGKTSAGILAGQVLALRLNVDISSAGCIPKANTGLGTLKLKGTGLGSIDGKTVAQVFALAETALGGGALPAGLTYSTLNDLVTNLNESFDNGVATGWANAHLAE